MQELDQSGNTTLNQDKSQEEIEEENNRIIEDALEEIEKSSDLLRTFDEQRQFARLHVLMLSMCCAVLYSQSAVLSLEEARDKGDKLAEYQHMLREQIKTQTLGWNVEDPTYDSSVGALVMYVLIGVHTFSYLIAKFLIGSARYTDPEERAQFPKKFCLLTILLLIVNGATAVLAVTTVINNQKEMGHFY